MTPSAALAIFNVEYNSYETAAGFNDAGVEKHSVYRSPEKTYLFSSPSLHECREWITGRALAAVLKAAAALIILALAFPMSAHARPCYVTERDEGVKIYLRIGQFGNWYWPTDRAQATRFSMREARARVSEVKSGALGRDPRAECVK